jgi:hypothetical protein
MSNLSFSTWENYFHHNTTNYPELKEDQVTAKEKKQVAASVAIFQKGERSEAKRLFAKLEHYASTSGNWDYFFAMKAFIREENRHASDLAVWMEHHHIPLLGEKKHWQDELFRWLRNLAGVELSISILLTAEIIATAYYRALGRSTSSLYLTTVCKKILQDEDEHLYFQSFGLSLFYAKRGNLLNQFIQLLRLSTVAIAGTIIYVSHYRVFYAGKINFLQYANLLKKNFYITVQVTNRAAWDRNLAKVYR